MTGPPADQMPGLLGAWEKGGTVNVKRGWLCPVSAQREANQDRFILVLSDD
jgi:hypothetical protein